MRRKLSLLLVLLLISAALFGCGKKETSDNSQKKEWAKFYRLDLSDAKAVINWPVQLGKNTVFNLYKLTTDNQLVKVEAQDREGNNLQINFLPTDLWNASTDYLMLWVSNDQGGMNTARYLVRKTDGRVFRMPESAGYPASEQLMIRGGRSRGYMIQSDGAGNLYYINGQVGQYEQRVMKLTVSDSVDSKVLSPVGEETVHFRVDEAGNVMYNLVFQNSFRVIDTNGKSIQLFTTTDPLTNPANCFTADGQLHLICRSKDAKDVEIYKLYVNTDQPLDYERIYTIHDEHGDPQDGGFWSYVTEFAQYEVNLQGNVYYLLLGYSHVEITEVYNPNDPPTTPRQYGNAVLSLLTAILDYDHTDNELYIYGRAKEGYDGAIIRFNPTTGAELYFKNENYILRGPYAERKKIIALGNGEILFDGIYRGEGEEQRMLGLIDAAGKVTKIADINYPEDHVVVFDRFDFHAD